MPAKLVREPKKVKARKKHTCQGCGKKIIKGDKYFVTTCSMDGEIYNIKECPDCRKYYKNKCINCDNIRFCVGENYYIGRLSDCQSERGL